MAQLEAKLDNLKGAFTPHADGDASIARVLDTAARLIPRFFDEGPMDLDGKIVREAAENSSSGLARMQFISSHLMCFPRRLSAP